MIMSRNLMFTLSVMGGFVIAAVLVVQRNERKQAAAQLQYELQVWENETGSFGGAGAQPVV